MKNIDSRTLKAWLDNGEAVLVDVREPQEHATGVIPQAALLPLAQVSRNAIPNVSGKKLVMQCRSGARSQKAALMLKQAGFTNVSNLAGGILAWADKIDPTMPKY